MDNSWIDGYRCQGCGKIHNGRCCGTDRGIIQDGVILEAGRAMIGTGLPPAFQPKERCGPGHWRGPGGDAVGIERASEYNAQNEQAERRERSHIDSLTDD